MNTKELVANGKLLAIKASSTKEFFRVLYDTLYSEGLVNIDFLKAITEREEHFPTGIMAPCFNIALPHVDACYVNTNALIICQNDPPVLFHRMDDPSAELPVSLAFVLLIKDPKIHTEAIAHLTQIWQSEEIMEGLLKARSIQDILKLL